MRILISLLVLCGSVNLHAMSCENVFKLQSVSKVGRDWSKPSSYLEVAKEHPVLSNSPVSIEFSTRSSANAEAIAQAIGSGARAVRSKVIISAKVEHRDHLEFLHEHVSFNKKQFDESILEMARNYNAVYNPISDTARLHLTPPHMLLQNSWEDLFSNRYGHLKAFPFNEPVTSEGHSQIHGQAAAFLVRSPSGVVKIAIGRALNLSPPNKQEASQRYRFGVLTVTSRQPVYLQDDTILDMRLIGDYQAMKPYFYHDIEYEAASEAKARVALLERWRGAIRLKPALSTKDLNTIIFEGQKIAVLFRKSQYQEFSEFEGQLKKLPFKIPKPPQFDPDHMEPVPVPFDGIFKGYQLVLPSGQSIDIENHTPIEVLVFPNEAPELPRKFTSEAVTS